jgi:hypothetical protein
MTTTTNPQLGVVESPDLAFALTLMGYSVIGGGAFRDAAMAIRSHETAIPVLVANVAGTGLRAWVSRQESIGSRVVVMRTEPDGPIPAGIGTTAALPISVNDLMALAGWGASSHALGSAIVADDFTIAEVGAYRPITAPAPAPVVQANLAPAPVLQSAPIIESVPVPASVVEAPIFETPVVEAAPVFELPAVVSEGDDDIPEWARESLNLPRPVPASAHQGSIEPIEVVPAQAQAEIEETLSFPAPLISRAEPVYAAPDELISAVTPAETVAAPMDFESMLASQQVGPEPVAAVPPVVTSAPLAAVAPQPTVTPVDFDQLMNGVGDPNTEALAPRAFPGFAIIPEPHPVAVPVAVAAPVPLSAPVPMTVQVPVLAPAQLASPVAEPEDDFDRMVRIATYGSASAAAQQTAPTAAGQPTADFFAAPVAPPAAIQFVAEPVAEPAPQYAPPAAIQFVAEPVAEPAPQYAPPAAIQFVAEPVAEPAPQYAPPAAIQFVAEPVAEVAAIQFTNEFFTEPTIEPAAVPAIEPVAPPLVTQFIAEPVAQNTEPAHINVALPEISPQQMGMHFGSAGQTVVSFAGKGGVGKTTFALSMAHRAASYGLRVALVDMNRGQGDVRSYLRLGDQNLPSIYNAAVSGRPEDAVIAPDLVAVSRPGLANLGFAVVLAPPADLADPSMVTAAVYAKVIALLQQRVDLVIIDTQITESRDTSGLIDHLVVPMLLNGAWGLGVTDMSNPGLNNLLARTKDFVTRGVPRERLLLTVNKAAGFGAEDHASIESVFSSYASFIGAAGDDLGFANEMNVGNINSSNPTIGPVIDAALSRITGRAEFAQPAPRRRFFGRKK